MKKICRYLLALPFAVLGIILVILYFLLAIIIHQLIYGISFFMAIRHFIFLGEWKWQEIKDDIFADLSWLG